MIPPVVMLAGGLGTRISEIANGTPKVLMPIGKTPFLQFKIDELIKNGVDRLYILAGIGADAVEAFLQKSNFQIEIIIIRDRRSGAGTGQALRDALPNISEEHFVLTYGDNLLPLKIREFVNNLTTQNSRMVVSTWSSENDFPNVSCKGGFVNEYEKNRDKEFEYIDYGYTVISKESFSKSSATSLEKYFAETAKAGKLEAYITTERYYDIGTPETFYETTQVLRRTK